MSHLIYKSIWCKENPEMNWMFVTIFLKNLMSIAMLYIVCAINDFTYITALC